MKFYKLLVGISFVTTLMSCIPRIPVNHENFISDKKTGVIVSLENIAVYNQGSGGVVDIALPRGKKFEEPLKEVEPKIIIKEKFEQEIVDILDFYKKPYVLLSDEVAISELEKFRDKKFGRAYGGKDFRFLKETHGLDEVFVIEVLHGILVYYYGSIEIGRAGLAHVWLHWIDLEDNSIKMRENYRSISEIKGDWREGENYEKLKDAIQDAVDKAVKNLDTKI